jgi:hypothetical protein
MGDFIILMESTRIELPPDLHKSAENLGISFTARKLL